MANTEVPADTLPVRTATELVAAIPVPASPSGGADRNAWLKTSGGVQKLCALFCQGTGVLASHQDLGQQVFHLPGKASFRRPLVKGRQHSLIICIRSAINGEHAGGISHAQHFLPGELPMDIARQGGEEADTGDVLLPVQNGLIEVRYTPALGDVELEQLGQLLRRLLGVGVAPSAEGDQQLSRLIKGHIAVLTTYISDYIFPSILREVENVLSRNRCAPLLFATQNQVSNERKVLQTLLGLSKLDGMLVEGTKTRLPNPNLDLYQKLIQQGIPLVFMNGNYPELSNTVSVLDDNYGGSQQLVHYLYQKGHRKIAGIFKSDDIQGHGRYAGYTDALRDLALPMEDHQICWYSTEDKERLLSGEPLPEEMIRILDGCTAVVCYNDEIASRLVSTLIKRGIRVPEDVAVVSFDNSQYSELSPVRITSLSHGTYNVGRMAAESLIQLLNGDICSSQVAPWILKEKESS